MVDCIFCKNLPKVAENTFAYAVFDISPVSKGHALVIPKRHFENIFDATSDEFLAIQELLANMRSIIHDKHSPNGYNIWSNCGRAAGQIVMHAHIHLIPRYNGEVLHIKEHLKGNIE